MVLYSCWWWSSSTVSEWVREWQALLLCCSPCKCVLSSSSFYYYFYYYYGETISSFCKRKNHFMNDSSFLCSQYFKEKWKKIMYGGIVKEFILCLLPHRQWKKSFVMPNTTTEERKKKERGRKKTQKERGRARKKIGEHGEEVAEANLAPPSNIFTLTTV